MKGKLLPRYPIYIPSKGRHDACLTAKFLDRDGVPFKLVVEPQEAGLYAGAFGADRLLVLPFSNLGQGSIPARNWIKDHAAEGGHERHWQLDDNIRQIRRWWKQKKVPCDAGVALAAVEDFVDRYENIAIAGLNYVMFAVSNSSGIPPFFLNAHVYSCTLVLNSIPYRWRGRYNEDTDICLQALAGGWCTILVNAFLAEKIQTMVMKGGNTDSLYQSDGRLRMAKALERMWPGVVTVHRRFRRPQHHIFDEWRRFDTPLKLKPGLDLGSIGPNDYGLALRAVKPIKSKRLRRLFKKEVGG